MVLEGDVQGKVHRVTDGMTIGRGEDTVLRLSSAHVSHHHACIRREGPADWVIEDLGSRNGTRVNGTPVAGAPMSLAFGDRIQLGGHVILLFTYHDPLEEQLQRRQKMEAVGQLAAGIAHDFNNILGVVATNLRYLEQLPPETPLSSDEVRRCLADLTGAAERAAELTGRVLHFTAREPPDGERVEASVAVEQVVRLLERTLPATIQIVCRLAPALFVEGHRAQLERVLLNLCLNARDAMPKGGTLTLEVDRAPIDVLACELGTPDRPLVRIRVEDTGTGMDDATRARIFEPFFTTKRMGTGTGLGLAAVWGVVTKLGGRIEVQSAVGSGTVFTIYLPQTSAPPRQAQEGAVPTPPSGTARDRGQGFVIVADDDDMVRRGMERMLRALGYQVLTARDGLEAIELFEGHQANVRAVLLDIDMPRPDGVETFLRLRQLDPAARVLLMSGYHDAATRDRLLSMGAREFFPKPVDLGALDRALHLLGP